MKAKILVVDDDPDVLHTARMILKSSYQVETENTPLRIESLLQKDPPELIILDMNFKAGATSGNEGLFWLRKIKELNPESYVIMNTAYGDINLAVESMKIGAVDFLVKPWEKEKLLATVNTVYQLMLSNRKVEKLQRKSDVLNGDLETTYQDLVFVSDPMKAVMQIVDKVANTDASVLILGENGTGKELLARAIHKKSSRSNEGLIKVDLGALSESLFESELFGHVKGSFTDAREDRIGRFEVADGGTLFLDEIGNLNPTMQVKLLSALQNRQITRIGSNKPVPIDIRLISATNQPLYEMVSQNRFRQDLLYRINTVEIEIPPLRERKADIPLLIRHYLGVYGVKYSKPQLQIDERALGTLQNYNWPGNIRELQHAVERAVIMTEERLIRAASILPGRKEKPATDSSLKVEDMERATIVKAIERCSGNLSQAAEELGIGRTTLYRKMEKYGL